MGTKNTYILGFLLLVLCFFVFIQFNVVGVSLINTITNNNPAQVTSYLDLNRFYMSPAESQEAYKRYPNGLVPLPLKEEDLVLLNKSFESGGYIIEFNGTPLFSGKASGTGIKTLARSAEPNTDLRASQNSFIMAIDDMNLNIDVNRQYTEVFNGLSLRNISISDIAKISNIDGIKKIYPIKKIHTLSTESVPSMGARAAWSMHDSNGSNITGKGIKIAIVDTGIDYTHTDLGACAINQTNGTGIAIGGGSNYSLDSPHPYNDNTNLSWNITVPGYSRIAAHIKNLSLEEGFDVLYIKSNTGEVVAEYTGIIHDTWTPPVNGSTITFNLVSDFSITNWGFSVDKVVNGSSDFSNAGCSRVVGGYDFAYDDNNPFDDYGHGTHCAAIAAGNGTLMGIAPDAQLLAYKVLDSEGSGSTDDVIAGIDRAVLDGANVISLSLGGSGDPWDAISTAVNNAVDKGVIVVVAAGNDGSYGNGSIGSPGCAVKALTVGASYVENDTLSRLKIATISYLVNNTNWSIDANAMHNSNNTSSTGLTAQMVNAGNGSMGDFGGISCNGKIALVDGYQEVYPDVLARNAYVSGCRALIIYDPAYNMANASIIPVVWVSNSSGDFLKQEISENRTNITLKVTLDPIMLADFSSRGPSYIFNKPDVIAPGVLICAARTGSAFQEYIDSGQYPLCVDEHHIELSGTSMATPVVAGVAALVKQKNPGWSPLEIKAALKNTANPYPMLKPFEQGSGLVNLTAALNLTIRPPVVYITNITNMTYRGLK